MRAMFSLSDLDFNGIKLGGACIEVDYTVDEMLALLETYNKLVPELLEHFKPSSNDVTVTEYMGEDGESLEDLLARVLDKA
jgi:hypothetical protein